ncbi:hypothetical protein [Nonomuraea sp. NPDC002799]
MSGTDEGGCHVSGTHEGGSRVARVGARHVPDEGTPAGSGEVLGIGGWSGARPMEATLRGTASSPGPLGSVCSGP